MMRRKLQLLSLATVLLLMSCSKEKVPDAQSSEYTIRYEVTTTSKLTYTSYIQFTDAPGSLGKEDFNVGTTTWERTVTLSSRDKLLIHLEPYELRIERPGSLTAKIYVNGVLKATKTVNDVGWGTSSGGYTIELSEVTYQLN